MTQAATERQPVTERTAKAERRELSPAVDIYENEQELLLVADLPGVQPASLRLSLDPPELRIEADATLAGDAVTFKRAFRVDERIDAGGIAATLESGVLRVRLPKSAALRPRRIEVKGG